MVKHFFMYSFGDEMIGVKETQFGNEYDGLTMHYVSLTEENAYEVPVRCKICYHKTSLTICSRL